MKEEKEVYEKRANAGRDYFKLVCIVVREDEEIAAVDFGKNMVENIGLQHCTYI